MEIPTKIVNLVVESLDIVGGSYLLKPYKDVFDANVPEEAVAYISAVLVAFPKLLRPTALTLAKDRLALKSDRVAALDLLIAVEIQNAITNLGV